MLRTTLGLLILTFSLASTVVAQEKSPSAEHLEVFAPLIGESTGVWTDGTDTVKGKLKASWGDRHSYVMFEHEYRPNPPMEGLPDVILGHQMFGWDFSKQKVTMSLYSNWGMTVTGEYKVEGNKLVGTERMVGPMGNVVEFEVELRIVENGTARLQVRNDEVNQVTEWERDKD